MVTQPSSSAETIARKPTDGEWPRGADSGENPHGLDAMRVVQEQALSWSLDNPDNARAGHAGGSAWSLAHVSGRCTQLRRQRTCNARVGESSKNGDLSEPDLFVGGVVLRDPNADDRRKLLVG
jgi:hypothetical protein